MKSPNHKRVNDRTTQWFRERPLLLPYIAVVSTLELIVTIFKG